MTLHTKVVEARRRFAVKSTGADERAERKARITAIHVQDDVFLAAADLFKNLVNACEDGTETYALVLRAPSGVGKSHVFDRLDDPRLTPFVDEYGPCIPVVRMSAPTPCNMATLGVELHYRLTGNKLPVRRASEIWLHVRTQLYNLGVSIIMLDEFHHLVETANIAQRQLVASALKALLIGENPGPTDPMAASIGVLPPTVKPYPIGLVLSGMPVLASAISLDLQLARRTRNVDFQPDRLSDRRGEKRFQKFLKRYADEIGFPIRPKFADDEDMMLRLHRASGGYRGRAAFLIKSAAFLAIDEGSETLELDDFARVFDLIYQVGPKRNPFVVPDLRRLGPLPEIERDVETRLRGNGAPIATGAGPAVEG